MEEMKQGYLQRLAQLVEPVTDAAEMLGTSRQFVHQLIAEGKLESVRLGRGKRAQIYVSSLSLQEFMDARALVERGPGRTRASKGAVTMQP